MRIRHILPTISCRTTVEGDRAFFLRNQAGDMLSLYTTPQTRYEGWYVVRPNGFLKLIERIELLDAEGNPEPISELTNTGQAAFWGYKDGNRLGWKLAASASALTISLAKASKIRIHLDIRGIYAKPEFSRSYALTGDADGTLVSYTDNDEQTPVYLHFRSKEALTTEAGTWKEQAYPRDEARHSDPTRLYVFRLGEATLDHLHIGYGTTPEAARLASLTASKQRMQAPTVGMSHTHDTLLNQSATAKALVTQALRWLQTEDGLYAGLPWFHQVWARDELIAALGLSHDEQREIIERYLGHELIDGELETFVGSNSSCADGVGWLSLLIREYGLHELSDETRHRLLHFLQKAREGLIATRQAPHGLIRSGHNATWMDTIGREGYRIEIQCMYALLLEHLYELTGEILFDQERLQMLGKIRQHFFKDGYLHDGLGDPAKRPNVFLAYLLQPDLLPQASWQSCFDTIFQVTQLEWGGLTSLDKTNQAFYPRSTGQDNKSYHNGDSWFFVNNLTAIALRRFNQHRYGKEVVGILQSSTEEILWQNMVGQPGEISSAAELESWGCGIQAFSGGTYLALLNELEAYSGQGRDSIEFFWESTAS